MSGEKLNIDQDVIDALQAGNMYESFLGMALSHQKEYLKWIYEAKKPELSASKKLSI